MCASNGEYYNFIDYCGNTAKYTGKEFNGGKDPSPFRLAFTDGQFLDDLTTLERKRRMASDFYD